MLAVLAMIALQAAPAAAPEPLKWSILLPVPNEPCRPGRTANGEGEADGSKDIVVCGEPLPSQRMPLPEEAIPDGPKPSNPFRSGSQALAIEDTPCAARQGGCIVGFGPPVVPLVMGAVDLAKDLVRKRPDRSNRIPIPLDDPAPVPASTPTASPQ